jgi:Uma2 family endonuclease
MSTMMASSPRRHQITVDEYHRMAEVGLLAPDARVELIEGDIIDMPPIGNAHGAVVDFLNRILSRAIGDRAILRVQGAVRLDDRSEPQPDFVLLAPREDFYRSRAPGPGDTLLIIEVSDTTARYDRSVKVRLYARRAIPEVWLVDLSKGLLTFFRAPVDGEYTDVTSTAFQGITPIPGLPGATIDLSRVLNL